MSISVNQTKLHVLPVCGQCVNDSVSFCQSILFTGSSQWQISIFLDLANGQISILDSWLWKPFHLRRSFHVEKTVLSREVLLIVELIYAVESFSCKL